MIFEAMESSHLFSYSTVFEKGLYKNSTGLTKSGNNRFSFNPNSYLFLRNITISELPYIHISYNI